MNTHPIPKFTSPLVYFSKSILAILPHFKILLFFSLFWTLRTHMVPRWGLRNGACGRAAAEETLRNGACPPWSRFLNARP